MIEFEFPWLLERKIAGFGTLEDLVHVSGERCGTARPRRCRMTLAPGIRETSPPVDRFAFATVDDNLTSREAPSLPKQLLVSA